MTYATVRAATDDELTLLRSEGQWSKVFLAVFKPSVIYSARLDTLPTSFDSVVEISFTSGSGVLADVKPDMTIYVGSSAGSYDLGVARIRKAPIAGTFYIGEESDIKWQSSCYLTVVNEFDLWAKHLRTVSDTEFYVDYDVAYTDQNTNLAPVPIMGSHQVVKLVDATVATDWDFSNSFALGSSVSSYSVEAPTSSAITGGATATPTIEFDTTGWHAIYLTVTAANGKTAVGVRYVYVYSDDDMPATVFQLGACSCDYETGGWSFEVTVQDGIALDDVPERALCILFAEDYYDSNTQQSVGQLEGCENIICVGKIAEEQYNINPVEGQVTMRVQGMQYWLSKINAFPSGHLLVTSTPSNWAEMQSPSVDKVLHRLLHWGSTATKIMDCYLTNDTLIAEELNSPATNMWAQIQELAFAPIQARPGVDRFTRMFIEVEPQLVPTASRTWATVMTITSQDWRDSINLQRQVVNSVGQISLSGVNVSADGTGNAIFSLSPGHVFTHYGSIEVIDRLLLSNQTLSNNMAGYFLAWRANQFPNTEMPLASNNRMVDCFPRQKVSWSIATSDTPRSFSLSGDFIPRRVELHWDVDSLNISTVLVLELGTDITSINVIDGDIPGSGDVSTPPAAPAFPKVPDFPIILPADLPPVPLPEGGPTRVAVLDRNQGIMYTNNFNDATPNWVFSNGGFDTGDKAKVVQWLITPNGAVYASVYNTNIRNAYKLYRAPALGQPFALVIDQTWLTAAGVQAIQGIGYNPMQQEQVIFITGKGSFFDQAQVWLGSNTSWTAKALFGSFNTDFTGHFTWNNYKWIYSQVYAGNERLLRFNADASSLEFSSDYTGQSGNFAVPVGITTKLFKVGDFESKIYYTDDNGTTLDIIYNEGEDIRNIAVANDGLYLLGAWTATAYKGRSSDGGYTWGTMPNLPGSPIWHFTWAGGSGTSSRWIAFVGTNLWYSGDWGNTWGTKVGDMTGIVPIPSLIGCIVPNLPLT